MEEPGCVQILLSIELKDNSKWRRPGCVQILLSIKPKDNGKWRGPGCVCQEAAAKSARKLRQEVI